MTAPAHELRRVHRHLLGILLGSYAVAPLIGYAVGLIFGAVDPLRLLTWPVWPALLAIHLGLLGWMWHHFRDLFAPLRQPQAADPRLSLQGFGNSYWTFYLLYVLILPTVQYWLGAGDTPRPSGLLHAILLQLVVAILVGMPGYLEALALLGRAAHHTGLDRIHVSMRSKIFLIGAYMPLLMTTVLLRYDWSRTGQLSTELWLAWLALGMVAFVITLIAIRSLRQSLAPVQEVISNSDARDHAGLARRLRPRSLDEIGYLIQTLGRLFQRLGEQESHMRAIFDHAAEGIIVIDAEGRVETLNPAAERLFGPPAETVRGQDIARLLPDLALPALRESGSLAESEHTARHVSGTELPVSLRASAMQMDDRIYYTLLVADISERKATEQMLLEAEARYRDLVETAHDLVWSMDAEGRWTYLNDAVFRIYGYPPSQMLHRHFSEFQAPESALRDAEAHAALRRGEELVNYETVHLDNHGNRRHISFNARPQFDAEGRLVQITGTAHDITEQKAYEQELAYQAQHDSLTRLYNRNYFQRELEREVARARRGQIRIALLYLDLDQFKYVNDTQGHAAGDRLLVECADLLRRHLREGDLLARFGGDEFTMLLFDVDEHGATRVADYIRQLFENYRFVDAGKTFNVTASIGISLVHDEAVDADEALARADLACNIAKSQGRNRLHLFDPADRRKDGMAEDMGWAARVREAFEQDRFKLAFQPIIAIDSGEIHDYEVLLRMTLDDGDVILPGGFMPAAERFGLIHQVDRWTVRRAMETLADLRARDSSVRFAINLSGRAFEDEALLPLIHGILVETGLDPEALTFEITESAAISNLTAANAFIHQLKEMGCQFALDDFGTGFSSFAYLKHLPVDKLKIDGSFVRGLADSRVDQAMVQSMNEIAHALGKQTIAEFVENAATLKLLRRYGVDFAQGHFLSRPLSRVTRFPDVPAREMQPPA